MQSLGSDLKAEHNLIEREPAAAGAAMTALKPPILFAQTQVLIASIESLINEPLITYWNSRSGSICDSDVLGLYGVLRDMRPALRMSLFIKSDGGSGQASLRMINLLRQQVEHLTVLVPLECASAGTMLALGANAIQMGPLAHLSAVDTSLTHDLSPLDRDNQRVKVSQDELGRAAWLFQGESGWEVANPYSALFDHASAGHWCGRSRQCFVHPVVHRDPRLPHDRFSQGWRQSATRSMPAIRRTATRSRCVKRRVS